MIKGIVNIWHLSIPYIFINFTHALLKALSSRFRTVQVLKQLTRYTLLKIYVQKKCTPSARKYILRMQKSPL